jgi:hypothetical protein
MLNGVMLLWFLLTAASVLFVAIDIRNTPESPVLKWGFILLTLYTGPVGAFLYVLGCREPLPGLHEQYVAARWRQTLGSTMHCVAGDGVGILVGAAIGSVASLPHLAEIALEYALGFAFGWTIFQALFMRDMFSCALCSAARIDGRCLVRLSGIPVDELADERDGRRGRFGARIDRQTDKPAYAGILVRDEHGAARRLHRRLSDQLASRRHRPQARYDDRKASGRKRGRAVASGVGHGPATAHSHGRSANATSLAGMSHDSHAAHGAHQSAANLAGMTILSIFALAAGVGLALAIARMS